MAYQLKQLPEDFVVTELPAVETSPQGRYSYFWLTKRGRNTLDAVKELARRLGVKEKDIGFAGSKDKQAVTKQVISVAGVKKERVEQVDIPNVSVDFLGYGNKPISLGDLEGNHFEITIRNIEDETIEKTSLVENYFDEQRFSKHNVLIGRNLVKKDFAQATSLIDDFKVKRYLEEKPKDYVGALKKLPLRLLRMYVNAYQSYLWNKTVAEYLNKKGKVLKIVPYSEGDFIFVTDAERFQDLKIPLLGFGKSDFEKDVQEIINTILKEEQLAHSDFVIKQIPELSLEGELRNVFVAVKEMRIGRKTNDELNLGKKKVKISFTLGKGSYATMVVKRMVG